MPSLEIDARTAHLLEFAARIANVTVAQVIARLVDEASLPAAEPTSSTGEATDHRIAIRADYAGFRTRALFDRATSRVEVVDGPLAGTSYKSPTGAARAIVAHYNPQVSPHRNGWTFWSIDDNSGRLLQQIRH